MISIGKVVVSTAGTAVQVTTSQDPRYTGKVRVTAFPTNTGRIYVGLKGAVGSTGVNILAVVGIPPTSGPHPYVDIDIALAQGGGVQASQLWLDAGVNGDSAIVAVL